MKQNAWGMLLVPLAIAAVMTPAILLAASGSGVGFDAVVRGIETRYHAHANRIPFLGLISGIAGVATHGGVRGLHVAEIENLHGPVDGAELNALVEQRVGPGWSRMIRDTTRSGGVESGQTLIYIRPDGDLMGMLIVDMDGHEANVVQISVNPDHLSDEISQHRHGKRDVSEEDAEKRDASDSE
jgi:hypothetical protein